MKHAYTRRCQILDDSLFFLFASYPALLLVRRLWRLAGFLAPRKGWRHGDSATTSQPFRTQRHTLSARETALGEIFAEASAQPPIVLYEDIDLG